MIGEGRLPGLLLDLLGEEGYVLFCQALGGCRLYIPNKLSDENEIVKAIGRPLAQKLSDKFAPATINVPLGRRERALWYRRAGSSNAAIARKLGISEKGIEKLFKREEGLPPRPKKGNSAAQFKLL